MLYFIMIEKFSDDWISGNFIRVLPSNTKVSSSILNSDSIDKIVSGLGKAEKKCYELLMNSSLYDIFICGENTKDEIHVKKEWFIGDAYINDGSISLDTEIASWAIKHLDNYGFFNVLIALDGNCRLMLAENIDNSTTSLYLSGYWQPIIDITLLKRAYYELRGERSGKNTGIL